MHQFVQMAEARRVFRFLSLLAVLLVAGATSSWASLSSYQFSVSTGTATDMSSATYVTSSNFSGWSNTDDAAAGPISIGFNFNFDGTTYTQFSVSTNGLMGLGSTTCTSTYSNSITGLSSPSIFALWDDQILSNGQNTSVSYLVTGTSPTRKLTVQWNTYSYSNSSATMIYQVRLYEGSNRIEFYYNSVSGASSFSASIGAFASSSNFASITSSTSTISYSSANNSTTPPSSGTLYSMAPCQQNITIAGNPASGGSVTMANGDSLLLGRLVQRGNSSTYQPLTIAMGAQPCSPVSYTYTISGANAGDYQISPASGPIAASGTNTPTITFTPTGIGKRVAQLTVADNQGFSITYNLAAQGTTRIQYIGNVSQGGTSTMINGDTLLLGKIVTRKTSQGFTPLSILNFNGNSAAPPANVAYAIIDPSGQYSVSPSSGSIGANQTSTPVVTFNPTGVGIQEATLRVSADGEPARNYLLRAFAAAPGGEFYLNGAKLGPTSALYVNQISCVGEIANTQAVTVTNTGYGDFTINSIDFYNTDTNYTQGTSHPLLRDASGRPIRSNDYDFSTTPGVAPLGANPKPVLPITLPQGRSITLYLTYVGQQPGKRYARAFIHTNGQNFLGTDTNAYGGAIPPTTMEGLLNFDLYGGAVGGVLSDNLAGGVPKTIVFPSLAVGETADMTVTIANPGQCDLRIAQKNLQIPAGDADEFKVLPGAFSNLQVDPQTGDYIVPSGTTTTLSVRFKPMQIGSRRASLWLKTNDSTVLVPGVTERGSFYLDLYGVGKPNLLSKNVDLGTAAIGIDKTSGSATFQNPSVSNVTITSIAISGTDAADFTQSMTTPWPTLPNMVKPGGQLNLAVDFAPLTGTAGQRTATLTVTVSTGETFTTTLTGMAGTRTLTANPTTVNFPPSSVGKASRQLITLTNSGTMPVTLSAAPALSGTNAADFSLSAFPRMMLAPGQIEYLEVTYMPTVAGTSTATVTFNSDAAGGAQTVALMAQASKTKLELNPTDVVRVTIPGDAGSHAVSQSIAVRNESDEAIRVTSVDLSGVDASQFRVAQTPEAIPANSEGTLVIEIQPNGHDLAASVAVHAENAVTGEQVVRQVEVNASQQRTSGVSLEAVAGNGMTLSQSVPNPAKGEATIAYRLAKGGEMELSLYDVNGVLVRQLETGYRESGAHQVRVDLSGLASGQYVYRLNADGVTLSRTVTVVK
jgi:hypothetical protein